MLRGYYLGCPGWGTKTWLGRLFAPGTKHTEFLAHYARVFNTVEGNTTFYALPTPDTVARWHDQTPTDFRFCFKFPRTVSHDRLLVDASAEVTEFFRRIEPLADKLGTLMLQLPPRFDAALLPRLDAFLARLPSDGRYAVELRHDDFFRGGPEEQAAVDLLRARRVDLVILDTRALHATAATDVLGTAVRGRKPALPIVMRATATMPIVRCVPSESWDATLPLIAPWPAQIAKWIGEGKRPYFFMHSPDDTYAPEHAYKFHALLRELVDVGELPPWPEHGPRQLGLF